MDEQKERARKARVRVRGVDQDHPDIIYDFIYPGGPRRSYHRSLGAYASVSHFSAICLLAEVSCR